MYNRDIVVAILRYTRLRGLSVSLSIYMNVMHDMSCEAERNEFYFYPHKSIQIRHFIPMTSGIHLHTHVIIQP